MGDQTSEKAHFRPSVFFPFVDRVKNGLTLQVIAIKKICTKFKFLCTYLSMINDDLEKELASLAKETYLTLVSKTL